MGEGGDTHPRLRAAAVQAASPFLDRAAGVRRACELIEEAAHQGADLVVFPESFIPGHPLWLHYWSSNDRRSVAAYERLFANALTVPGDEVRTLCDAAAACDANVVIGVTEKRLVPTVREKIVHAPVAARVWRWSERQRLALRGRPVRLLTSMRPRKERVATFPSYRGVNSPRARRRCGECQEAHAPTSSMPAVDVRPGRARVRTDHRGARRRSGGSSIVDPAGRVLACPLDGGEEGIVVADLELGRAVRGKLSHDFTGHYNRFDVFELRLRRTPRPPLVLVDDEGKE